MMRKKPQQLRSEFTVRAILEAAFQLLGRSPSHKNPTAREISHRAGVSVGTLYHYFKGTESILNRMVSDTIQKDMGFLISHFEASEGSLADRLLVLVDALLRENVKGGLTQFAGPFST